MEAKIKVLEWIDKNFKMDEIKLEDFKMLPGGTLLTDSKGGQMLIFYDVLNEQILYSFPGEKSIHKA